MKKKEKKYKTVYSMHVDFKDAISSLGIDYHWSDKYHSGIWTIYWSGAYGYYYFPDTAYARYLLPDIRYSSTAD